MVRATAVSRAGRTKAIGIAWLCVVAAACLLPRGATAGPIAIVSLDSVGSQQTGSHTDAALTPDGRFVAFVSTSSTLVAGDTNGVSDIFLRDRQTGQTTRVSVATGGGEAVGQSLAPCLSDDGRYVAFTSYATNLVTGDTNSHPDVFVHDAWSTTTQRVSLDNAGIQIGMGGDNPSISGDGRYVAFTTSDPAVTDDTNGITDVYVRDTTLGATVRASVSTAGGQSAGISSQPVISGNGRYVAFTAAADDLVTGDANGSADVLIRDLQASQTTLVSLSTAGTQGNGYSNQPSLSADGTYVAFISAATNLVAGDTNAAADVFVRNRTGATTTRASVDSSGAQGVGVCQTPAISANGRHVAFVTDGPLTANDGADSNDVYVRNTVASSTYWASQDTSGLVPNGAAMRPSISQTGRYVAFESTATDLTASDANAGDDVFLRDVAGDYPDAEVKILPSVYMGAGIVNTDGTDQTAQQTTSAAVSAGYGLKLVNTGTVAGDFRVTGQGDVAGWQVRYYDALTGGNDITSQVTGAGWGITNLVANAYVEIRVEVKPDHTVPNTAPLTRLVTFTSLSTAGLADVVGAQTTRGLEYQPDLSISTTDGNPFLGNDAYNTDGTGQDKTRAIGALGTATYWVQIQNDGSAADQFRLTGPAGASGWTVAYFDAATGGNSITAAVTGTGWTTGSLAVASSVVVRIEVTADATVVGGDVRTLLPTAASVADGSRTDTVKAETTQLTVYRPDLLVGAQGETPLSGDGIYNTTGAGQQRSQEAAVGGAGRFDVSLQNDGNVAEAFVLQGPGDGAGWTVAYVLQPSGTDITTAVTGAGYETAAVARGGEAFLLVTVTPDATVADGAVKDVLLTATSKIDSTQIDAVLVQTTKRPAQPDLTIRTSAESTAEAVGDGVYNLDAAGQTKTWPLQSTETARYVVTVQNDGPGDDTFVLTGSPAATGWTVEYFNAATGGTNITGAVGAGHELPLPPGGAAVVRLEVTPGAGIPRGAALEVDMTATSADGRNVDVARASTMVKDPRPDALVSTAAAAGYVGDGTHNNSGVGQAVAQTVEGGSTATYYVRIENDGNFAEPCTVVGSVGDANWTIRYFDAAATTEITAAVTGAGWQTPAPIVPGQFVPLRVEVTPATTVPGNEVRVVTLKVRSAYDATVLDAVNCETTRRAHCRPDVHIRRAGETGYLGDNVYSADGTGQQASATVRAQQVVCYELVIQNDGNIADSFRLLGPPGAGGWSVLYHDAHGTGGTDITGDVTTVGWVSPVLAPGATAQVRAELQPDFTVAAGTARGALFACRSVGDGTAVDAVDSATTVADTPRPDALLRNQADAEFTGDDVMSLDGTGQTCAQTVQAGTAAVYHISVHNDGNFSEPLTVTAPAVPADWTVAYYSDAAGTTPIAELSPTGSTWTTPAVAPGSAVGLRVDVTPGTALPGGSQLDLLVTCGSSSGPEKDAVLASTTVPNQSATDLGVRAESAGLYTGLGTVNATGANQTAYQTVGAGVTAAYIVRLQNAGNVADRITVTGPAGGGAWSLRYVDPAGGGADITAAVTGAGWTCPLLPMKGAYDIRAEITPSASGVGGESLMAAVQGRSVAVPALVDTVRMVTTLTGNYLPDAMARPSTAPGFVGADVYSTDGADQTAPEVVPAGTAVDYDIRVVNRGTLQDAVLLRGPAGTAQWSVRYSAGGTDITPQVTGAGWLGPALVPGGALDVVLRVVPNAALGGGQQFDALVSATSQGEPSRTDAVIARTITAALGGPDGWVRCATDTDYLGQDVYNLDGAGQTAGQTVGGGVRAAYHLKFVNKGNAPDRIRVTGPAAGGNWTVAYADALAGGTDITALITSTGYLSPTLAVGDSIDVLVQVMPDVALPGLASFSALVTAVSTVTPGAADAVRAVTTRAAAPGSDCLARRSGDTTFVGANVFSTDGAGQSVRQTAAGGTAASFDVRVVNIGPGPDAFTLTAPAAPTGWHAVYIEAAGGADITAQVTGAGWTSPAVAAGAFLDIRVEVTPDTALPGFAEYGATVRAASLADATRADAVGLVTERQPEYRPDAAIRLEADNDYTGEGTVNADGAGQSVAQTVRPEQTAAYRLRAGNAGNAPDQLRIQGPAGGSGWTVAYLAAGVDVTADVTGAGWVSPTVAAGADVELQVTVTPDAGLPGAAVLDLALTAGSEANAARLDVVRAETTCASVYRPDALIHTYGAPDYIGDGLYNGDASGQTEPQAAADGTMAQYQLLIQNDGNTPDSLRVRGSAAAAGWEVSYVLDRSDDGLPNLDITADVGGAGWVSPVLARGENAKLILQVTPNELTLTERRLATDVTATSEAEPNVADTVRGVTTLESKQFTGSFGAGTWLVGPPAQPTTPAADQVFGTTRVARWDAATQAYQVFSDAAFDVALGSGYWARWDTAATVQFDGYPSHEPVTVPAWPGWNLLGNPLSQPLPLAQVTATGSVAGYAWTQNAAGTGYQLVWNVAGIGQSYAIPVWKGFWYRADEPCDVTLGSPRTAATCAPRELADWVIRLCARAGDLVDADNYVGAASSDVGVQNPPAMAPGYLDLYLVGTDGRRDAVSLRAGAGRWGWDMVAETDLADTVVELTFPDLSSVPSEQSITLTDLSTDRAVNVRTSAAYSFRSGPDGARRHLRLEVAPRKAGAALVTALTASTTGAGVQVSYALASAGEVDIEVRNIAGRLVAAVPCGTREAGAHIATWSGLSQLGTKAPRGRYIVSLRCRAQDGTEASSLVTVRLP